MPKLNLVTATALIVIYYVVGTLGMMMAVQPGNVTPIYPAAGLAWAIALIYGKKAFPIIFFGGFFSNLVPIFTIDKAISAVATSSLIGLGEALSVGFACYILKKLTSQDFKFSSPIEVLTFSIISIFWIVSPSIGVSALLVGNFISGDQYWFVWCTWWLGDSIGILLTTPLLFCIYQQLPKQEAVILNFTRTALACIFSLLLSLVIFNFSFPVVYLLTLFILLSSFWLDQRSTLIVNIVVAAVATYSTLSGFGPFIEGGATTNLLILQLFIAVNIVTSQLFWTKLAQIKELGSNLQTARFEARKDSLTNILNRRGFDERTHENDTQLENASVLILDIDDFKNINDTYGHDTGDEALRHMTDIINHCVRTTDIFARVGGEEFSVFMNNTQEPEAQKLAERICKSVASSPIQIADKVLNITVSIGVTGTIKGETVEESIHRADELLYQAKREGKNRVISSNLSQ
jgi:diguanylate cyclase (GGDEF)-like protein